MRMSFSVAVAGASGYAGGEVLRLLLAHPDASIGALTAASSAGTRLGAHHPHLLPLADREIVPTDPAVLGEHDVVVLALPHGASAEVTAALEALPRTPLMIDCGADHRLTGPAAWEAFYGSAHAGAWPYGMPELLVAGRDGAPETAARRQRATLAEADRIAVPGCNVTAVTLALQPGVAQHVVDASDVVAVLAVGYSGAGRSLKPNLLAAEALGNLAPYAVGGTHRHIPEIEQNLFSAGGPDTVVGLSFTPVLVPTSRGILATVTAPLAHELRDLPTDQARARVRGAWADAYADEPLVHLLPEGTWPTGAQVTGSAAATVQVDLDPRAGVPGDGGRVVAICAIDNLGKGTAAAAVQSLNLALGLPESRGLTTVGVAP